MNKKEQIKNYVINAIVGGHWKMGEKILSERKICELLKLSRTTVRNALQELSFSNWLESRTGAGYFVSGYGSYDTLFTKGRYKIKSTSMEEISSEDQKIIEYYFEHDIWDKNKIFVKKYFDQKKDLKIFTINIVNKDFAFYLDDDEIQNGFIQSLLNHKVELSFQNREVYMHNKKSDISSLLGWKENFPIIISSLFSNKWIVERSIIIMHKDIFHFGKKVVF